MEGQQVQQVETLEDGRWQILAVICVGVLMMSLDTTIVNVALPSIATDLHFTETSLAWVVNAYMVPYGGLLLLCGRLGDCFGHQRMFLLGIAAFTVASIACGLAPTAGLLVGGRMIQGLAAAAVLAVSLSLILQQFEATAERAQALGIYSCMASCGGSAGLLLGGILTSAWGWRWIFLVNVPLGLLGIVLVTQFFARWSTPSW